MSNNKKGIPIQETLLFMAILTALGGYLNAYSFITHGAFTTLHTGNMVKLGMSVFQSQWDEAIGVLIPICGNVTGAFLAELLKRARNPKGQLVWQKSALASQLVALLAVGFIPMSVADVPVNWVISVIAGFQLSNFRTYEGSVHNTTICTGNLRTVGQYIGTALLDHNRASIVKMLRYGLLVFSFPLGAGLGTWATLYLGQYAAWICCGGLVISLWLLCRYAPVSAETSR